MKKTVACYVRVSTQEQAKEGYSIGEQIERLTKYADAMNWIVYKVYTDAGYSGASTDRPGLQEMITDIERGKISIVLVYKLDRLSRSQLDALYLLEKVFLANGADFVSMSENFDTASPFGRATIGMLAVFAQLEREQIKERLIMGKEARIKEGKWTGGITPFGYEYAEKRLKINEYEAVQVRELFTDFVNGKPLFRIEQDFNAKGYRLRNNPWSLWSIKYMLTNRVYSGYVRHKDEWVKGLHEPIIDEATQERATSILQENSRRFMESGTPIGSAGRTTYLGGLIYCARCGARYGKRRAGKPDSRYYTYVCYSRCKKLVSMVKDPSCKNKIYRVDELDKIIFDEIRKLALDPERLHQQMQQPKQDGTKKLRLIEAELKTVDNQISRFMDLYGIGRFTVEQLDAKLVPLEQKRNALQNELCALKKPHKSVNQEETIMRITSFADVLNQGNFDEIRAVLEALIDRIEIDGDDITIRWNFE